MRVNERTSTGGRRQMAVTLTLVLWSLGGPLGVMSAGADAQPGAPYGIERRVAWTASRVLGSPEPPPPLRAVRAFPKLNFASPLYFISEPAARQGHPSGRDTRPPERMFVV